MGLGASASATAEDGEEEEGGEDEFGVRVADVHTRVRVFRSPSNSSLTSWALAVLYIRRNKIVQDFRSQTR